MRRRRSHGTETFVTECKNVSNFSSKEKKLFRLPASTSILRYRQSTPAKNGQLESDWKIEPSRSERERNPSRRYIRKEKEEAHWQNAA